MQYRDKICLKITKKDLNLVSVKRFVFKLVHIHMYIHTMLVEFSVNFGGKIKKMTQGYLFVRNRPHAPDSICFSL
jgi:hypothetical protein